MYDDSLDVADVWSGHSFSVEWSKIEPKQGEFNQAAIDHYHQVGSCFSCHHSARSSLRLMLAARVLSGHSLHLICLSSPADRCRYRCQDHAHVDHSSLH